MDGACDLDAVEQLVDKLLAQPEEQWAGFLMSRLHALNLEVIESLKRRVISWVRKDRPTAERMVKAADQVAAALAHEPLAWPLARWTHGAFLAYITPDEAVECFYDALVAYEASGDHLSVGRLYGNLVFSYTDTGQLDEADRAFSLAQSALVGLGEEANPYILNLLINRGWLLFNQDRYHEALAINDQAALLAKRLSDAEAFAEVQVNQSLTFGMLGRLPESEKLLLESRVMLLDMDSKLTVARIDMNLGELYTALDHYALAFVRLQLAQEEFKAQENRMELGSVLLREARLLARIGALRDARKGYGAARRLFLDHQLKRYTAETLLQEAVVRRRLDPWDYQIQELLSNAEAVVGDMAGPVWVCEVGLERAEHALVTGQHALATALLQQIRVDDMRPALLGRYHLLWGRILLASWEDHRDQAEYKAAISALMLARASGTDSGAGWIAREALVYLSRIALETDVSRAFQLLEEAAAYDDRLRAELSVEDLKASFQEQTSSVLAQLAYLAANAAQPERALSYTWRAKGSALLELITLRANHSSSPPAAQAEIDRVRRELAARRWRMAVLEQVSADDVQDPDPGNTAAVRALEQRLAALRRQVNQQLVATPHTLLTDPSSLLSRLDTDLLVEYMRYDDQLIAIRLDHTGHCACVMLGSVEPMLDCLDRIALACHHALNHLFEGHPADGDKRIPEIQLLLREAYDLLLAPIEPLPADGNLLLAPCDLLSLVPFAALFNGDQYLIQRCQLELIPSGALLAVPHPESSAIDDSIAIGSTAEGRLPAVAEEIAAIQRMLTTTRTFIDDPAGLDALLQLRQPPRVLHLAAHTVLKPEASILAALQLSGGMLSIDQCYDLPLTGTELAVLSGCETAAGMESGGSLLAFQSALLVAGARRVLSSLWSIDDRATAHWMTVFYELFAEGIHPGEAVRRTQLDLMHDPQWVHPVIWASFTLYRR